MEPDIVKDDVPTDDLQWEVSSGVFASEPWTPQLPESPESSETMAGAGTVAVHA
jgi:hypothetical protein